MSTRLTIALTVAAVALSSTLAQPATADPPRANGSATVSGDTDGMFLPVTPARLLDTRYTGGRLPAGGTRTVLVKGRGGVPTSGVSAVVVNLTVTGGTRSGYLSAYPGGTAFSGTSALNFAAGETRANLVTLPLGADGSITVLNGGGPGTAPVNVIVDVQGYYLDGQTTPAAAPLRFKGAYDGYSERVVDTRTDGFGALAADYYFTYGYYTDEGFERVVAYALNVTAVSPTASGYLVAWDGATNDFPVTSVVNFAKGRTTPNNVVVPSSIGDDSETGRPYAQFAIGNGSASGKVHVLVDVVGVYVASGEGEVFRPLAQPERVVDTRVGKGLPSKLYAGQTQQFTAPGSVLGPDPDNAFELVGNLTAVRPTAATYLTLYPDFTDYPRPGTSNLNPAAGQTVANHTFTALGGGNRVNVFNAAGSTDVLLDVTGYFLRLPSEEDARPSTALRADGPSGPRPSAPARGHVADATGGSR